MAYSYKLGISVVNINFQHFNYDNDMTSQLRSGPNFYTKRDETI